VIKAWHASRGRTHRDVCLIPSSAHGTNPASAQMAGMRVVVVACDRDGNVDLADLEAKAAQHATDLAAIMVTYPSTHGVFERGDRAHLRHRPCARWTGVRRRREPQRAGRSRRARDVRRRRLAPEPAQDVLHPARRRRSRRRPVACKAHLAPFLPGHRYMPGHGDAGSAAQADSSRDRHDRRRRLRRALRLGVDPADLVDVRDDDGRSGLAAATQCAILAANYVAKRLAPHYPVLYSGSGGLVAHECILDLRPLKAGPASRSKTSRNG
jgi:glycine dehydrogenase